MFFLASVFILLKQKQNVLLIVMGFELVTAVSAHYKLGLAQPMNWDLNIGRIIFWG